LSHAAHLKPSELTLLMECFDALSSAARMLLGHVREVDGAVSHERIGGLRQRIQAEGDVEPCVRCLDRKRRVRSEQRVDAAVMALDEPPLPGLDTYAFRRSLP
jgi:hypothetical protein